MSPRMFKCSRVLAESGGKQKHSHMRNHASPMNPRNCSSVGGDVTRQCRRMVAAISRGKQPSSQSSINQSCVCVVVSVCGCQRGG